MGFYLPTRWLRLYPSGLDFAGVNTGHALMCQLRSPTDVLSAHRTGEVGFALWQILRVHYAIRVSVPAA